MWKVYSNLNAFYIVNGNEIFRRNKAFVEIRPHTAKGTSYDFVDRNGLYKHLDLSEIVKEDGVTPYTQEEFEALIDDSTGFNPASGGSEVNFYESNGSFTSPRTGTLSGDLETDFVEFKTPSGNSVLKILGNQWIQGQKISLGRSPIFGSHSEIISVHNGTQLENHFMLLQNNYRYAMYVDKEGNWIQGNSPNPIISGSGSIAMDSAVSTLPGSRNYRREVGILTPRGKAGYSSGWAIGGGRHGSNNGLYYNYLGECWSLGGEHQDDGEQSIFSVINGTGSALPVADGFKQFSQNVDGDGTAAPHFLTESGDLIKLFKKIDNVFSFDMTSFPNSNLNDFETWCVSNLIPLVDGLKKALKDNHGLIASA